MKVLHNKLIYDTEKLDLLFNLDQDNPKDDVKFTQEGTNSSTPTGYATTIGSIWITSGTSTATASNDFIYTNYIARTPNNRYVTVLVKSVKNHKDENIELSRKISRFFKDEDEIVEYLADRFGKDILYDTLLTNFFEKIGVKLKNA
jgi:hypothetical protein